jgi:hypothetical protein
MISRKFEPVVFGLLLSGLMSLVVSGISTLSTLGLQAGFLGSWTRAWLTAWLIAFPVVLAAAPLVRRFVQRMVDRAVE